MPVDGLVEAMSVTGRHNAQHFYGIEKGWWLDNTDAWAMQPVGNRKRKSAMEQLGDGWSLACRNPLGSLRYTRDTEYLRNTAYPLMKGLPTSCLVDDREPNNPNELITALAHRQRQIISPIRATVAAVSMEEPPTLPSSERIL